MNIILKIETHAYAEEKLCDEILNPNLPNDNQSCGIVGSEVIVPLRQNRNCELIYDYTEDTLIKDVEYEVLKKLDSFNKGLRVAFLYKELRYWIDNAEAKFQPIVKKYLDPHDTGKIAVAVFVSLDAGAIYEEEGVRYYMNSHEAGKHNEPHVHICDASHEHNAVVIISDGRVIGKFPTKLLKKAKKRISQNQHFFLEQWNALTDGIKVDVNSYLGTIKY